MFYSTVFFFFQAEDGIRDYKVTGVQTCALPISRASVRAGESLSFHVSTNPPSPFTLDIYRMGYYGGAGGRLMRSHEPFKGATQPDPPIGEKRLRECRWEPCVTIKIPKDWLSGVYLGKLTSLRESIQSYVIFIL